MLSSELTQRLIEQFASAPPTQTGGLVPAAFVTLTPREMDVLRPVAPGLNNREIADDLVGASATVKTHVARIPAKLGLRDRIQAAVAAYEHGLLTPLAEQIQSASICASTQPLGWLVNLAMAGAKTFHAQRFPRSSART